MFSSDSTHQADRNALASNERYRLLIFFVVFFSTAIALLLASKNPVSEETARTDQELIAEISSQPTNGCAESNEFISLQSVPHPPYGRELIFKTRPRYVPGPSADKPVVCKQDSFRSIDSAQLSVRELGVEQSNLLIAFRPGDAEFNRRAIPALQGLVISLGPHERAAVYLWGGKLLQIIDFTSDKQQLNAAIAKLENTQSPELPLARHELVREAQFILNRIGDGRISHQQIVGVLSQTQEAVEPAPNIDLERGVAETIWTGEIDQSFESSDELVFPWPVRSTQGAVIDLVTSIKDRTLRNHFRVGYCSNVHSVTKNDSKPDGKVQKAPQCNARDIAEGRVRGSNRIDLLLSSEAQFIYEARKSLADLRIIKAFKPAKRAFPATLRLNGERDSLKAIINIRGAGTLSCKRRSFGVELTKGQRARLFPNSDVNRFNLLSLCKDATLIKTHLGASIFRHLGLFPLQFRYVEVMINGKSNGIYLATEHPVSAISRAAQPIGLLRRGYEVEAGGPLETGPDAIREFQQVLDNFKNGTMQEQNEAEEQLGLDRYLLWLAVNSMLLNGDYLDELWLLATAGISSSGTQSTIFSAFAWDFDALFTECHQMGKAAVKDPHGLLYCAESDIARIIVSRPELYDRYVKALEAATQALDNVAFDRFVERSLQAIEPFADNREMVAITYQLDQRSGDGKIPSSLRNELQAAAKSTTGEFSRRRQELLERIENYRSKQAQLH
jgi:hypothetical protein